MRTKRRENINQVNQNIKQPSQSKLITLEDINTFYSKTDAYFSKDIQRAVVKPNNLKNDSDVQYEQDDESIGRQILIQLEAFVKISKNKFQFDDQAERQVAFQEGLKLISTLIEKYQTKTGYKKSSKIKKFLTAFLSNFNTLLVQKIFPNSQTNNQISYLSSVLNKINQFLIQSSDNSINFKLQSKHTRNPQIALIKQFKSVVNKNYQIDMPLLLNPTKKIPYTLYLILSFIQKQITFKKVQNKNYVNEIYQKIDQFCQQILIPNENRQFSSSVLLHSICTIFGQFDYPVGYLFMTSLVKSIERQFMINYKELNRPDSLRDKYQKQLFSSKNLLLLFNTLIRLEKNTFEVIVSQNISKDIDHERIQIDQKIQLCSSCNKSTIKFTHFIFNERQNHGQKATHNNFFLCIECTFLIQDNLNQQLSKKQFEAIIFSQKFIKKVLLQFGLQIYSKNTVENQQIKNIKKCNQDFLKFFMKNQTVINNDQNELMNLKCSDAFADKCIKTVYFKGQESKPSKSRSINHQLSFRPINHLKTLLTIILTQMNSSNQFIRIQTINLASSSEFITFIRYNLTKLQIQQILAPFSQESLDDENNKNKQSSWILPTNLESLPYQVQNKHRLELIIRQIKLRLHDNSNEIKMHVLTFVFKIKSIYNSQKIALSIYEQTHEIIISQLMKYKSANSLFENRSGTYQKQAGLFSIIKLLSSQINTNSSKAPHLFNQEKKSSQSSFLAGKVQKLMLKIIFICFSFQTRQKLAIFTPDQIQDIVKEAELLIKRLLKLMLRKSKPDSKQVDNDQQDIKETAVKSKKSKNRTNEEYENMIVGYLKEYYFTKETIRCFIINDCLLEKLIALTNLISEQSSTIIVHFQKGQKNSQILLSNIKLILEELLDFSSVIQNNNDIILSKSKSKKAIKSKKSKKLQRSRSFVEIEDSLGASCSLNKVIKSLVKIDPSALTILNCEILALLLQKNILLSNETNWKSRLQPLVLTESIRNNLRAILIYLQSQLISSSSQSLSIYIKLFVMICIQINEQKAIQRQFLKFKKVFDLKRRKFEQDFQKGLEQRIQPMDQKFLIKTLQIMSGLSAQHQRFRKMQNVMQADYSPGLRLLQDNISKYSFFPSLTSQILASFQMYPEICLLHTYQTIFDLFEKNHKKNVKNMYGNLLNSCCVALISIFQIYPQLSIGLLNHLKLFLKQSTFNAEASHTFLKLIQSIISSKDSILINRFASLFEILKQHCWNIKSQNFYELFEDFYSVAYVFMYEEFVNISQYASFIFFGLFINNKNINIQTIDILKFLNKKGMDTLLLADFSTNFQILYSKLYDQQNKFFIKDENFTYTSILNSIQKQYSHKASKNEQILLPKDLNLYKIRYTFAKRLVIYLSSHYLNSLQKLPLKALGQILFTLKFFENLKELDAYELHNSLYEIEKFIKKHYYGFSENIKINQNENSKNNNFNHSKNDLLQEIYSKIVFGQSLYTIIGLLNQKKLAKYKKQLETSIQAKRFTKNSINIKINIYNSPNSSFPSNIDAENSNLSSMIKNYQSLTPYFILMQQILSKPQFSDLTFFSKISLELNLLIQRMYNIIFKDEPARVQYYQQSDRQFEKKIPKNNVRKPQRKGKKQTSSDSDSESSTSNNKGSNLDFSDISSMKSFPVSARPPKTKKIRGSKQGSRPAPRTKRVSHPKGSFSAPKGNKLTAIFENGDEQNMPDDNFQNGRRSKRQAHQTKNKQQIS